MKSRTGNNSISNINDKYTKKQLNNITNRIRSLEKDINLLKNKEIRFNKKPIDNNTSIIIDKNSKTMISNDSKLKSNNKNAISHKSFIKKYLFYNDNKSNMKFNTNNNSFSENKLKINTKKKYSKSQIYRKINNYHSLIHEKKNTLLNYNSHFNKRKYSKNNGCQDFSKISLTKNNKSNKNIFKIDYLNEQRNFYNRKIQSDFYEHDKIHHFMSVDKINTNLENNNKIINDLKDNNNRNEKTDMEHLDYEFEIRHLIKKKNLLKDKNKEINEKLEEIKNNNIKIENKIFQQQKNNKNILDGLIKFNKKFMIQNNGLENFETLTNRSISDDYSLKDIILNIMDIKFDYENNILFNNFIEGINELLNIPLLNNKNCNDNIFKKLTELIKINKNLEKINNKYQKIFRYNNKYLIYFKNLLKDLNLQNFEQFYEFVKNLFVKNVKEKERLEQIKKALINDSKPNTQKLMEEKENLKKKIFTEYSNSVNQSIMNNKNYYHKIKKSYINKENKLGFKPKKINNYIYSKRKYNEFNFNQKILNKTDKIDNFNQLVNKSINLNHACSNKHLIAQNNIENNYQILFEEDKKNEFIPLNFKSNNHIINNSVNNRNKEKLNNFIRKNYYKRINNCNDRYNKQNNSNKNEDDIFYLNDNEEEKINTFNKRPLAKTKNHSAFNIIFNNNNKK